MKKSIVILGAGSAALSLAAFLNPKKYNISIYEKNKAAGRKFLVAGKGGFNLTHSQPIDTFVQQYTPVNFLKEALLSFSNEDLIDWLKTIGISTFVGSSGRVYPDKGIKPIEVLKAILEVVRKKGVTFHYEEEWLGWGDEHELLFSSGQKIKPDYCVFALGGASWKVTGSNGSWLEKFAAKGIKTIPFKSSNCGYEIEWPSEFITKTEGKPLKNLAITCHSKTQKGEAVITKFGLEGNAIYALSPQIQKQLDLHNQAEIFLDLKPTISKDDIRNRIYNSKEKRTTDILRNTLNLNPTQVHLLKKHLSKEEFLNQELLAEKIKRFPLIIKSAAPLDEAISTTGGIDLTEVNNYYELKNRANTFVIGEMVNWNAPTGGYLLQACFSMGVYLARNLNQ